MIARAKHKERAKAELKGKLSGMIGANLLTGLLKTAGTGIFLVPTIMVLYYAVAFIVAGSGSALLGSYGSELGAVLGVFGVFGAFSWVLGILFALIAVVFSLLTSSMAGIAAVGNYRYYMKIAKNGERPKIITVFEGFNDALNIMLAYFYRAVFLLLWSLPGVVLSLLILFIGKISFGKFILISIVWIAQMVLSLYKKYEYSMVEFIKADCPNLEAKRCLDLSKKICEKHIVELFVLDLSFLGWNILNNWTWGLLGVFYVEPYARLTYIYVYRELMGRELEVIPMEKGDVPINMGLNPDDVQDMINDAIARIQPKGSKGQKQAPTVSMMGLSGIYRNVPFELRPDETLIIGRDPSKCHIVISSGAEKVSNKHCSIRFVSASNEYEIIDYSSNGTLADGKKIPSNVPVSLHRGTVLSLADNQNSFRLE